MTKKAKERENPDDPDTPFLEWTFGAIGLALFAGAIIVMSLGLSGEREAPMITVTAGAAEASADLFRVEYSAFNAGDETASDVHLVARLMDGETAVEEQETQIDLLPGGSTRHGGLYFRHNPAELVLEIKPVSYQAP
ncbi:MAG: hypothetical protein EON93_06800 [Burkholderiales bacterium]|nr:MAG: hypothetical protein EON93_06800 [Burkholderiales bacterium]